MVNLNLISKDKFKQMGFKNKSTDIAFINTTLQTKVTKFNKSITKSINSGEEKSDKENEKYDT